MRGEEEAWDVLGKRPLLDRSPWLRLEEHHLRLPDGREIPDWLWVETPDFVNVVAVTPEDRFVCLRQRKYALEGGEGLALVGGYLEPGEDAASAARRELAEEAGYRSEEWVALGRFAVDGNRGCGRAHFFLARNCQPGEGGVSDDLEAQEIVRLRREEVLHALQEGRFGVLPWTAALALALLHGGASGPHAGEGAVDLWNSP